MSSSYITGASRSRTRRHTHRTRNPKTWRHKNLESGAGKQGLKAENCLKIYRWKGLNPCPVPTLFSQATTPVFILTSPAGKQRLIIPDMRHEGEEAQD